MKNELDFFRGHFWRSMRELYELREEVDSAFDDVSWSAQRRTTVDFAPSFDFDDVEQVGVLSVPISQGSAERAALELSVHEFVSVTEDREWTCGAPPG